MSENITSNPDPKGQDSTNLQNTHERLRKYIEEKSISVNHVARVMGLSATAISQYLNNKYPGKTDSIEKRAIKFLGREAEKKESPKEFIPFLKLSTTKRFYDIAKLCHYESEIGVIIGDAGIGKTIAAKEYCKENPEVILIEADLGYSAKNLFTELHRSIGYSGDNTIHDMLEDCVDKLKDSGRMIIIDEAENLPYKALDLIRRIYDKANIGLLLVGMPRLLYNMRGRKGEYAQLYSRVAIAERIVGFTRTDVFVILKAVLKGYAEENLQAMSEYLFKKCGGTELTNCNGRQLEKTLLRSKRVAYLNKMPVNPEIIEEVSKMLIK